MVENVHNYRKLPWNVLDNSIEISFEYAESDYIKYKNKCNNIKSIEYFSIEFFNLLVQFANTLDNTSDTLDPRKWSGAYELFCGAGAQTSHLMALVCIYIELNLLILNWKKYSNVLIIKNSEIFKVCLGEFDWGLPDFLADQFREIYDELLKSKSDENINAELILKIKKYLNVVFKSLYMIIQIEQTTKTNYLDSGYAFFCINWIFGINGGQKSQFDKY